MRRNGNNDGRKRTEEYVIGNCDIDFFNFEILNQFKRNQNFAVIFQKY